jgi:hypothetical protein
MPNQALAEKTMFRTFLILVCLLAAPYVHAGDDVRSFVDQLAKDAFSRTSKVELRENEEEFRRLFSSAFLSGFLGPDGWTERASHVSIRLGVEAGRSYRKTFPEQSASILKAYGYVEIETAGRFFWNPRNAGFQPDDYPRVIWSLAGLGVAWPERDGEKGEMKVQVKGFLSPKGGFGHAGDREHELLVTHMEKKG